MARTKKAPAEGTMTMKVAKADLLIPSGITLLDLACTDTTDGFCETGHGANIIGDRNSGKTAVSLASAGETFRRHGDHFDYKLLDLENAYNFPTERLWGKKFAKAFEVIPVPHHIDWCTEAIADRMVKWMEEKPQFFILDSVDFLRCRKEHVNPENLSKEGKKGIDPRAMANNYFFRMVIPKLAETGSFLIYLSQARVNIGHNSMFVEKVRSGGSALGFNAYIELWLSPGKGIKTGGLKVGAWTYGNVERSKSNGKNKRRAKFPILPAYGVDDTRANIEWLVEEGIVKKTTADGEKPKKQYAIVGAKEEDDGEETKGKFYNLNPIGIEYFGDDPYLFVEENGHVDKVVAAVKDRWDFNEAALIAATFGGRKSRYE